MKVFQSLLELSQLIRIFRTLLSLSWTLSYQHRCQVTWPCWPQCFSSRFLDRRLVSKLLPRSAPKFFRHSKRCSSLVSQSYRGVALSDCFQPRQQPFLAFQLLVTFILRHGWIRPRLISAFSPIENFAADWCRSVVFARCKSHWILNLLTWAT